jgi:hypothetical protein
MEAPCCHRHNRYEHIDDYPDDAKYIYKTTILKQNTKLKAEINSLYKQNYKLNLELYNTKNEIIHKKNIIFIMALLLILILIIFYIINIM